MTDTSKSLFLGLVPVALLAMGCACLFKTTVLVEWARKDYLRSSRLVQAWPFSNLVLKSWFPIYVRGVGLYALLAAVLVVHDLILSQQ